MKELIHKYRTIFSVSILVILAVILVILMGFFYKKKQIAKTEKLYVTNGNVQADKKDDSSKENSKDDGKKAASENEPVQGNDATAEGEKYTFDSKIIEGFLSKNIKVDNVQKIAFLTFDDGPSTTVTPRILDILNKENVKATFFVVGNELLKGDTQKSILKRIYNEGHAIGNHTFSHKYNLLYPRSTVDETYFMDELNKNEVLLKETLGQNFSTRVVRVPGGHMSWKGMDKLDKRLYDKGYTYIDWNVLTGDAEGKGKNKDQILEGFKKTFRDQKIVVLLSHDIYGKESTAEALPDIIRFLKEKGYEFKTLK